MPRTVPDTPPLPRPGVDPLDIAPRPIITELLRTRQCVLGAVFLVEHVDELPLSPDSSSRAWRAVRLLLGDGELCIQALLRPELHHLVDNDETRVGSLVKLGAFFIRERDISGKHGTTAGPNKMVYLSVYEMTVVGRHAAFGELGLQQEEFDDGPGRERATERSRVEDEGAHGGLRGDGKNPNNEEDIFEDSDAEMDSAEAGQIGQATEPKPSASNDQPKVTASPVSETHHEYPEEAIEQQPPTSALETAKLESRDRAGNGICYPNPRGQRLPAPVALPRDWTSPAIPLKLAPLSSIPHLPYRQNWSVNVLVIVAALSDAEPSPFPPPSHGQRTALLADPSTSKRVHLTVFLDPEDFSPLVGSVVLLAGVKNHLFDGGSLRKYVSDRPRGAGHLGRWWFPEPRELGWCDVEGLERWWGGRVLEGEYGTEENAGDMA